MATLERFEKFKEISRVNVEKVCMYVCIISVTYFCIYIVYMCVGILGVWQ